MERTLGSMADAGAKRGTSEGVTDKRVHHCHWSQQDNRVLEQLRALYSDQERVGNGLGVQTDVLIFGSDGGFVEAHKVVLALCSPYFQDLFKKINQAKVLQGRSDPAVVVLPTVTSHQLKHLIQFIYTGEAALSSDQMDDFLALGNVFKIDGITYSTNSSFETTVGNLHEEPSTSQPGEVPEKSSLSENPQKKESKHSFRSEEQDLNMDINYDSYKIKVESTEAELISEAEGNQEDPLAFGDEEEEDALFSEEVESQEKDDPTYVEEMSACSPPAPKRSRRNDVIPNNLTDALSQAPQSSSARLKKTTTKEGRVIWHNNQTAHANHSNFAEKTFKILESMSQELKEIKAHLHITRPEGTHPPLDFTRIPTLPLTNRDSLEGFETWIQLEANRILLVQYLGLAGGATLEKTTRNVLRKLFSKELKKEVNFTGKGQKVSLASLKLLDCLKESVRITTPSATDQDIQKVAIDWFRNCY